MPQFLALPDSFFPPNFFNLNSVGLDYLFSQSSSNPAYLTITSPILLQFSILIPLSFNSKWPFSIWFMLHKFCISSSNVQFMRITHSEMGTNKSPVSADNSDLFRGSSTYRERHSPYCMRLRSPLTSFALVTSRQYFRVARCLLIFVEILAACQEIDL